MKLMLFLVGLSLAIASSHAWFMSPKMTPAAVGIDEECLARINRGSCEMYDCIHQRHQCDILIRAAKASCLEMVSKREQFDHQGKLWLNATGPCLTRQLVNEYKKPEHNCDSLTKWLKEESTACALDVKPNLCDIFEGNKRILKANQNSELSNTWAVMMRCGASLVRSALSD